MIVINWNTILKLINLPPKVTSKADVLITEFATNLATKTYFNNRFRRLSKYLAVTIIQKFKRIIYRVRQKLVIRQAELSRAIIRLAFPGYNTDIIPLPTFSWE